MKRILALCGYPTAGKDAIAEYLESNYGFNRIAFADPLRKCLLALDPFVSQSVYGMKRLSQYIEQVGWTEAKKLPEVRQLLQRMGTEVGRELLGRNVWIDIARKSIEASEHPVVITDMRFENEVALMRSMSATLIHVTRPGAVQINNHASERLKYEDVADGTIHNNGTLDDLYRVVDQFVRDFAYEHSA